MKGGSSGSRVDDEIALLQRRLENSAPRPRREERIIPPPLEEFFAGVLVNCWDASLNNTAFADIIVRDGRIEVIDKGTIRPVTVVRGYLGTWDKSLQLRGTLRWQDWRFNRADHVVVEAPSVGGGHRTESSLIAGLRVYEMAPDKVSMVSATHVSWVLTGQARLESHDRKQAIRRALAHYIPGSDGRGWNEHIRDAVAAGLAHLWDLSQAPETMDLVTADEGGAR